MIYLACGIGLSFLVNCYLIYRMSVIKKKMKLVSDITTELSSLSQDTHKGLLTLRAEEE